ncbi:MAG: hypothetical protein ACLP1X_08120 [Polyangiaceae bacterium]
MTYDANAWREFQLVDRMTSEQVREFVTNWPDCAEIEVRRCACGQVIARKSGCPPEPMHGAQSPA